MIRHISLIPPFQNLELKVVPLAERGGEADIVTAICTTNCFTANARIKLRNIYCLLSKKLLLLPLTYYNLVYLEI